MTVFTDSWYNRMNLFPNVFGEKIKIIIIIIITIKRKKKKKTVRVRQLAQ